MKEHFHAVRFYENDESLCRIVADFIGDGLAAGEPTVVLATRGHRELIKEQLGALSFDTHRLQQQGDLTLLDAAETLATFMKRGTPDPDAFFTNIGGVLNEAVNGRDNVKVRAYGEMVDWLWKHDETTAAIRLEVLWNELSNDRRFSLLCGYSMGNFYKHGAYEDICGQHTHVISADGQPTKLEVRS